MTSFRKSGREAKKSYLVKQAKRRGRKSGNERGDI
nr:MAG TPA: hypothetical protein [Caudoviricetes sp.]